MFDMLMMILAGVIAGSGVSLSMFGLTSMLIFRKHDFELTAMAIVGLLFFAVAYKLLYTYAQI